MVRGVSLIFSQLKLKLTLLLLLFASLSAWAESPQAVFRGTLGSAAVVFELNFNRPEAITGRYFYQKYKMDLPLNGSMDGKALILKEGADNLNDSPRPTLMLQPDGYSGWQGSWTDPQGKILPLHLTPVSLSPSQNDAYLERLRQNDPYEYLRVSDLPLEPGKVQTFMGYKLQWWQEPQSKVAFFTLISGFPDAQLSVLNNQLKARMMQEVINYHSCMMSASHFAKAVFKQKVTPEFISPVVISAKILTEYGCGGAHPDVSDSALNLNAQTSKHLALEDVFWVGKDKPFHYSYGAESDLYNGDRDNKEANNVSFETYLNYREKRFASSLIATLNLLYPDKMQKSRRDYNCDYRDDEIWYYPNWYFTSKGLMVVPSFARAMRSCEDISWSVLPWSYIGQHPGGVVLALPKQ